MINLVTIVYDSLGIFNRDSLNSFSHKIGFVTLKPDEVANIKKERELFGMESITDLHRKVLYGLKDKRFNLEYTSGKEVWVCNNWNDYQYAIKNLVLIN